MQAGSERRAKSTSYMLSVVLPAAGVNATGFIAPLARTDI
jgi:hypothetical protein